MQKLATAAGIFGPAAFTVAFTVSERRQEGYSIKDFRADLLAALVVGVVALPLSRALAIAVDVPPQHGLYTAIIAGFTCALLGGTRFQVTGPTAAFVVILVGWSLRTARRDVRVAA